MAIGNIITTTLPNSIIYRGVVGDLIPPFKKNTSNLNVKPRWCLVANLKIRRKDDLVGTKLYFLPQIWDDGYKKARVVYTNKHGKIIFKIMRTSNAYNWRVKLIYKPSILKFIYKNCGSPNNDFEKIAASELACILNERDRNGTA